MIRNASPQQDAIVTGGLVGQVQLVNDRRFASSRETDPIFSAVSSATGVAGGFATWGFASRSNVHGLAVRYIAMNASVMVSRDAIPAGLTDLFLAGVAVALINDEGAVDLIRAEAGSAAAAAAPQLMANSGGLAPQSRPEEDAPYLAIIPPGATIVFQASAANTLRNCNFAVQAVRWI